MLIGELPDLEKTASGKDLIAIGVKRGEKCGEERGKELGKELGLTRAIRVLIVDRFSSVPDEMEQRIETLPRVVKEQLLTLVARAKSRNDVEDWLRQQ